MGKAERVLDNVFRPLANKDAEVFLVQMVFETEGKHVSGYFMTLATPQLLNALTERIIVLQNS